MSAVAVEQHLPVMMNGILQKSLNIRDDGCCLQHPDVTILEAGRVGHCHLCAMETKDAQQLQFQLMGDTYTTLSSSFLFGTGESAASLSSNTQHSNSPVPQKKRSVGETKEQRRQQQQQQQQPLSSAEESLVEQKQQQVLLESILARWMQVQNQATTKETDEEPQQQQQQQQHLPRSLMALTIPLILNDLRKLACKVEGQQRIISNQSTQMQELKESLEEKHANTQDMLQTILQQVTKNASTTTTALATSASAPVDPSPRKQKLQKSSTAATPSVAASMASSSCPPLAAFSVTSVPASANVADGSKDKSKEEKIFRAAPNSRRKMKRRPSASSKRSVRSLRSVDSSIKTPLTRHDSNKSFTLSELRMVSPAPPPQAKQSTAQQQQDASQPLEIEFSSPLATAAKKTATNISHDNNDNLEGSLNLNTLLTPMATTNNNAVTTTPMTDHSSRSRDITLDGSHHSLDHRDRDMPDLGAIFEEGLGDDMKLVKRKKFNLPANFGRTVEPMEIILEATLSGRHITGGKAININNNAGSNHGVLGTVGGEGSYNNNNSNHISNQHRRKLLPTSPEDVGLANDVDVTPYKYKTGKAKTMNTSTNTKNNKMAVVGHSSMQVFPTQEKVDVDVGLTGHMSLLMLDGRSASPDHDSDLSESIDSDEDDEDDETYYDDDDDDDDLASYDQETLDDTTNNEPNDYSIENLKHEAGLEMIDMYGDRGTYSGTVAPDGDPTGFGTMKYDSGRFFKGEWKRGRWNGKGTLLNANGDSYQGDFVNDARHGKGIYRFTSGDVYEGDFYEDNRHGKGKFKFHNGSVYEGDFCMGSFEGFGRYEFEGGYYEGDWRRDEYYGKGRLEYLDGSNYQGKFKRGSAHGFGVEKLADGTVRCGLWKRGEFLQECTEAECKRLDSKKLKTAPLGKSVAV